MVTKRTEMWIAGASAVVALGSLVVSIVTALALIEQGEESRTHYRKTVTPMVLPYVSTNPADETWGIFLKNEGIGPAVINYQGVILDGRISDMHNVVSKMREEGALGPATKVGVAGLRSGSYLGVGKRSIIFQVDPSSLDALASAKFHVFVRQRIDVRFEWCSVYEGCQEGCTKELCRVSPGQTAKH